jgi:GT2 family glycosyltransferase
MFRTELGRSIGPLDRIIAMGGCDDQDWGPRWWNAGSEVVYFPEATVIHDYRRVSAKSPISKAAWRHLRAFIRVQRKYRRQRRELASLQERIDHEASSSSVE